MLTRLLQAIAITIAIYLTMITHQSPRTPSPLLSSRPHYLTIPAERVTYLLAQMLDVLLTSNQRGAGRHNANIMTD